MQGSEFRGLAEAVTRTYGDNPWYFLRELAQNSRDAGARAIRVEARADDDGSETIVFADDGRGMTLAHARRFLFRLHASDKGSDPAAAGRYGVGFWTVLRFAPSLIRIESRRGGDAWAVELDAGLAARASDCRRRAPGTTVTLVRAARSASPAEFARQVGEGLRAYCRYLRRNDRRGSPLSLVYGGSELTEPMALPGPLSLRFRSGPIEGAVGLAENPEVRLYARGLPVWRGAALDQMSVLNVDAAGRADVGGGLAPVFLLNGNHLDVTFSRDLAVENRALALVRRRAEAALRRLLEISLQRVFPRRWPARLLDRLRAAGRLLRPGWLWLPLVALALLALGILVRRPGAGSGAPDWFSLDDAPRAYPGAAVSADAVPGAPPLVYSPPGPLLLRLFAADVYDAEHGFIRGPRRDQRRLSFAPPCGAAESLRLRLKAGAGETLLPLPPGWALVRGTLAVDGRPVTEASATAQGEAVVRLGAGGWVAYAACPTPGADAPRMDDAALFRSLPPGFSLPDDLEAEIAASRSAGAAQRAALALALTRDRLAYSATAETAGRFRREAGRGGWLDRVLRIGAGDCDVVNGLQVLLLRRLGVPARLVIGMVGDGGVALPRLHAWAEYFDGGWLVSDATPVTMAGVPVVIAPPAAGQSTSPAAALRERDRAPRRVPHALPILMVLLAVAALAALLARVRRGRAEPATAGADEIRGPLLQIARQSLLRPDLWGADNPLRRHPLLPLVNGGRISLLRAKSLSRRHRLLVTANRNPLALSLAAADAAVLDLSQPAYAPLHAVLEEAVDADLLCRLRPEPPGQDGLLAAVNAVLASAAARGRMGARLGFTARRSGAAPCLLAAGTPEPGILAVELPVPPRNPPFYFPRRFIAVSPQGQGFLDAEALFRDNPGLAVLRFLRLLGEEGALPQVSMPSLLRRAARRLLEEGHE